MITRILAAVGAATLALMAFWGFLLVIAPSMPTAPAPDKAEASAPLRNPVLRDVSAQPHTAVVAAAQPDAPAPALSAGPSPIRPLPSPAPAASLPATPASSPPPQAPADRQFLASESGPSTDAIDAMPLRRQRHSGNCTRYRTYDPQTQSYRGFDGLVHPCS